jgi:hypothetical protein
MTTKYKGKSNDKGKSNGKSKNNGKGNGNPPFAMKLCKGWATRLLRWVVWLLGR